MNTALAKLDYSINYLILILVSLLIQFTIKIQNAQDQFQIFISYAAWKIQRRSYDSTYLLS